MRLILITLFAVLVLVWVLPAGAANTQITGEQGLIDPATGMSDVSGGLEGLWYTTSFQCNATPTGERWPCTGTELFVGCLNTNGDDDCDAGEPFGTLVFEFEYTGSPVENGRCHHTIVDGGGAFVGASGVITMKDRPTASGLVTTYKGHIDF